jgi:hypothetical protein
LSVKTKVHLPRSPSALLSKMEREKVFLEVHVQNLTSEALWFETMKFECMPGWQVQDGNLNMDHEDTSSIFTGSSAMMQPQDLRQYVYILTPTPELIPSFPISQTPGATIPLGRLDISWRGPFGEPGRLLTSVSDEIPVRKAHLICITCRFYHAVSRHLQRPPCQQSPRICSVCLGQVHRSLTLSRRLPARLSGPVNLQLVPCHALNLPLQVLSHQRHYLYLSRLSL